jgi:probable rRNA maturation factor
VSIEIANESGVDVDEADLAALARHVLDGMRMHPLAELSVLLVDRGTMSDLHERWMGEPGPTDVLAFPMDEIRPPQPGGTHADHASAEPPEIPGLLGDVVICPQVATAQAKQAGHAVGAEISLLCTHGILHLLGYDHAEPDEHTAMFGLQDKLLASWRAEQGAGGNGAGPGADAAPAGGLDAGAGRAGAGRAGAGRAGAGRAGAGRAGAGRAGAGQAGAGQAGAGQAGAGGDSAGEDEAAPGGDSSAVPDESDGPR